MSSEPPRTGPKGPPPAPWRQYAGMGVEFAGAMGGMTLAGYWIDLHYGTGNKGVLILGSVGLVGGMYNFIRQALALTKETPTYAQTHERHDHGSQSEHDPPERPDDS